MSPEVGKAHLAECRAQIDAIDRRIVSLLNERTRIVERIGDIKRHIDMAVYEPGREELVIRNVVENSEGPLEPAALRRIFQCVIEEMREIQRRRMQGPGSR